MTLTQPWATVFAGGLAVLAASIAYLGVMKNVSAQRRSENRARPMAQLDSATEAVELAAVAVTLVGVARSPEKKAQADERAEEAMIRLSVERTKLLLFGLTDAAHALTAYLGVVTEVHHSREKSSDGAVEKARLELMAQLAADRRRIENG